MRLTKKSKKVSCGYIPNYKENDISPIMLKLGQLEDILEKHEITDIEELDKILNDYDEQALFIISVSLFLQQKGLIEEFRKELEDE